MLSVSSALNRLLRRTPDDGGELPIREELFSIERLEHYAAELAAEHKLSEKAHRAPLLLPRLEENGRKLVEVYDALAESIRKEHVISPAAEWLVDNFHIVEEQVREIREDLPRGYYYELPKLADGPFKRYPRIYALSVALIAHTDSFLVSDTLRRFINSYQTVSPLSIGELWAVPISLRIALVENLRRLATRIVSSRGEREEADKLADKLLDFAKLNPQEIIPHISGRLGKRKVLGRAFIVQLMQRLREQDPAVLPAVEWLEKQLHKLNLSIHDVVNEEHTRQAAAQVTVGNIITSMRLLSTLDWRDFFETVSLVDPELAKDPAGVFSKMDFATRDRYRKVIERISKRAKRSEIEVARSALQLSEAAPASQMPSATQHIGYYIIGKGLTQLESITGYQLSSAERIDRAIERYATEFYLGSLAILTGAVVAAIAAVVYGVAANWLQATVAALLTLIPASDFAISVVNWTITHTFKPRLLPKLNLSRGIPSEACTMVVVPVIVSDEATVQEMIEKLEVAYLANQDEHIYWALLADYADASQEHEPSDDQIIEVALQGIEELNQRYPSDVAKRFRYFHRRRQWCETENKWIGWERKRGKLREFNRLLRGARDTSFIVGSADEDFLSTVRYVITLDADTQMPRETACRLIGTALHPLNQPQFGKDGHVIDGYAILQPRVSISLESASRSTFARTFSGNTGVDPYTTAASDVYQDLFGSGIYTGKGLYDVDAFERALDDRVPDQTLLSHDLFESIFARAALVTDIEFLDDYPTYYDSFARRQHRWTRGDWQIAGWLGRKVRDFHGQKRRNRIPAISRWQIVDNLRRSLLAPSIVLLLLAGWTILPGSPWWWAVFVLLTLAFPVYAHVTTGLLIHPRGVPWTSHFWSVWGDVRTNTAQIALEIVFLAHQAVLMTDAIGRTIWRKLISHQHLLEWVTAASSERTSKHDLRAFIRYMWPVEVVVVAGAALIGLTYARALPVALMFLAVWAISPAIAFLVSRRREQASVQLTPRAIWGARIVARRTWRFFETFVSEEDHWLPPDNFQEDPKLVVAHRTSPTNIGLLLLSTIAAYDLGYIGLIEMVERLEATLASLQKLQKFRGHFFNWHDTKTLQPLWPHYVSVVDSGNLAGCFIALQQACIEIPDNRLLDKRILNGLSDTLASLQHDLSNLSASRQRTDAISVKTLADEIASCSEILSSQPPATVAEWLTLLETVNRHAVTIDDIAAALLHTHGSAEVAELRWWSSAFLRQTHNCVRDVKVLTPAIASPEASRDDETRVPSLSQLTDADSHTARTANEISARLGQIAATAQRLFDETEFKFLLDEERKVFTIGYNVSEGSRDNSFYDLLASEARVASFIAIAKGDVPQEHWFRMGRQLTSVDGGRALISWTGTMFEYLMPLLIMRNYDETLLAETYQAVVSRQIEYGGERGVPWGISESAYAARDLQMNYQYGPFGVPGLGLKRGLIEDLVVSPYSTLLAATLKPAEAIENLRALRREGALSRYGFYEALDFTPERVKKGERCTIVHAYMAHHQGMSLIALNNLLNNNVMQHRFHSDARVQATELLLQERIPRGVPAAHPRAEEVLTGRVVRILTGLVTRAYDTADLPTPRTQLLSNGNYTVMITTAGGGYSRCGDIAVTRWREDATRDNWGSFIYVRDVRSGGIWSTGHQPIPAKASDYEVAFSEDKADFWRRDSGIVTHMEAIVSAEDNAELRRVTMANFSNRPREIELTSYAEIVLAPQGSDVAHPAFSNLFVETEFNGRYNALYARRRPRSSEDPPRWGFHVLASSSDTVGGIQFETDRSRFLGRGHSPSDAISIVADQPLSNTVGAVLDPIFSLRCRVRLQPNETAQIVFTTGIAESQEHALALSEKYYDVGIFERESRLAWTRAQVEMTHLHIDPEEAHLFQRLAGRILYSDPSLRPTPHVLALNKLSQSRLWAHGISGDLPLVILRLEREEDVPMAKQLLRAHQYLRSKGLQFDLLILNDHPTGYAQSLQDSLQMAARTSGAQALIDKSGGVFIRRSDQVPEDERILLHAVARLVIVSERGSLEDQLVRRPAEEPLPPDFQPRAASQTDAEAPLEIPKLSFFNGVGGFAHGGREYVATLGEGQWTPAPWSNVIANHPDFGFLVTETGGGFTWSVNSHENRLSPWSNDVVSDPPGEIIYLRDEESGATWTPTPLPIREAAPYLIRHGPGYSVFEHASHGISQELLLFAPLDAPVKISLLRLRNRSERKRRLSITDYVELVLGVDRPSSAPHIVTDIEEQQGAIFARNSYSNEFSEAIGFVGTSEGRFTMTCDRKEFIGRNGSLTAPAALRRTGLGGRDGAGLDPCAAIQTNVELAPGELREIIFLFGEGETIEQAREINSRFRNPQAVNEAFERVLDFWDQTLGTIEIKTPDASLDTLVNRWLLYQVLACRVRGRSAFYQSSGAFGFRDQLQDVMALVYSRPEVARAQIVLAASRQFKEGDVLHWWHEPSGRGVRTRFSDDLLWLPLVVTHYVNATGDRSVLDETVTFLEADPLKEDQVEAYIQPKESSESGTILEHCARAIDCSLGLGEHGLPLMGSGDWNDGMNRVGWKGKGESVWLGWFLCTVLEGFEPLLSESEARSEPGAVATGSKDHLAQRRNTYAIHFEKLRKGLEKAWDGDWYRRAYFDDGTPLGSAQNDECKIDSIAQTWAVISDVAETYRAQRAMAAVEQYLVRRGDGLIILFTPPFDKSKLDPGYIKGYVPGVRENGGQYTHAALWTVIAFALLGDGDRAGELFGLLNPINHASTRAGLHRYKVEPYVAPGDVYAVPPHTGRGGWTWYTGSAGWMYRAAIEYILGFKLAGDRLRIDPCIPRFWREFEMTYRRGDTTYRIKVENPHGLSCGVASMQVDGKDSDGEITLADDGRTHEVRVLIGEKVTTEKPNVPTPTPEKVPT
jgi:cyclic beta-1,2-glucan glucanotransferase